MVGYRVGGRRADGARGPQRAALADRRRATPARSSTPTAFQPIPAFRGRPRPGGQHRRSSLGTGFTAGPPAGRSGRRVVAGVEPDGRGPAPAGRTGEPFVYAYYDGIDKIAHVPRVRRLLRRRAASPSTGWSGTCSTCLPRGRGAGRDRRPRPGRGRTRALPILDPELLDDAVMVSGEARFRWLHARRVGPERSVADRGPASVTATRPGCGPPTSSRMAGWFGGRLTADGPQPGWATWPSSPTGPSPTSIPRIGATPGWSAGTGRSPRRRCWYRSWLSGGMTESDGPHDRASNVLRPDVVLVAPARRSRRRRRRGVDRDRRAAGQGDADRLHDQAAARRGAPGAARRGQPGPAAGDLRHSPSRSWPTGCRRTCARSWPG